MGQQSKIASPMQQKKCLQRLNGQCTNTVSIKLKDVLLEGGRRMIVNKSVLDISTTHRDYSIRTANKTNAWQLVNIDIIRILSWGNDRKLWADTLSHGGIRKYLPYGMWVTTEGEWVLYNRRYQPFMIRTPGGRISGCDPKLWVEDIDTRYYFFNDGCAPNNIYYPSTGINKVMINTFNRCCEVIRLFVRLDTKIEDIEQWCTIKKNNVVGRQVFEPKIM